MSARRTASRSSPTRSSPLTSNAFSRSVSIRSSLDASYIVCFAPPKALCNKWLLRRAFQSAASGRPAGACGGLDERGQAAVEEGHFLCRERVVAEQERLDVEHLDALG